MKQLEASLSGSACIVLVLHHAQDRDGMPELFGRRVGNNTYYIIPFPNSFPVDFVA